MEIKLWNIVLEKLNVDYYNSNILLPIKNKIKRIDYNINNYKLLNKTNKINLDFMKNTNYINNNLQNYIYNNINLLCHYNIENQCDVYFYYNSKLKIDNIVNKIFKCYNLVTNYLNIKDYREIHLILTPDRKKFNNLIIDL